MDPVETSRRLSEHGISGHHSFNPALRAHFLEGLEHKSRNKRINPEALRRFFDHFERVRDHAGNDSTIRSALAELEDHEPGATPPKQVLQQLSRRLVELGTPLGVMPLDVVPTPASFDVSLPDLPPAPKPPARPEALRVSAAPSKSPAIESRAFPGFPPRPSRDSASMDPEKPWRISRERFDKIRPRRPSEVGVPAGGNASSGPQEPTLTPPKKSAPTQKKKPRPTPREPGDAVSVLQEWTPPKRLKVVYHLPQPPRPNVLSRLAMTALIRSTRRARRRHWSELIGKALRGEPVSLCFVSDLDMDVGPFARFATAHALGQFQEAPANTHVSVSSKGLVGVVREDGVNPLHSQVYASFEHQMERFPWLKMALDEFRSTPLQPDSSEFQGPAALIFGTPEQRELFLACFKDFKVRREAAQKSFVLPRLVSSKRRRKPRGIPDFDLLDLPESPYSPDAYQAVIQADILSYTEELARKIAQRFTPSQNP